MGDMGRRRLLGGIGASTGRKLWQRGSGGIPVFAAAAIVLLVSSGKSADGTIDAINARTGTPAWTRPSGQNTNVMAAAHGTLYLGIGDTVTAVAAATHRALWTSHLPAPITGIALAASTVYVADRHGTVHALVA
jgi:outer membrane protein assembly factor BamB